MININTKERIQYEALKLFSQKGYEAVGVIEIADAVGIKAPSLYKHFKNKRAIFDSVLQRMNELDFENAKEYEMPESTMEEDAEAYESVPLDKIKIYTRAQFLHWTKDEFSSCFRKLLTLEQYKSDEMSQLYHQYISSGPLNYMADIFRSAAKSDEEAMQLALDFYGPMYLLYSVYDDADDKESVIAALDRHLDGFSERFKALKMKERDGGK